MGVIQLAFLNVLGAMWIIRSFRMNQGGAYEPRVMYWLHIWYSAASFITFSLWAVSYETRTAVFGVKYEFEALPSALKALGMLLVIAVYAFPLLGIQRVRVSLPN